VQQVKWLREEYSKKWKKGKYKEAKGKGGEMKGKGGDVEGKEEAQTN
jgi:hypothetical protein